MSVAHLSGPAISQRSALARPAAPSPERAASATHGLGRVVNCIMEFVLSPEAVARRRIAAAARTRAETLNLSCMKLKSLPLEIGSLVHLRSLHLWHNELASLPPQIGRCVELQELYLANNRLSSLPDSLGHLPQLRRLYLHGNPKLHLSDAVLGPRWEVVRSSGATPASARAILEHYFHRHSL